MKLKTLLKENQIKAYNSELYDSWEEEVNPDQIIVYLKNGRKIKIGKKRIPNGSKVYMAILKAFADNRYDITDKIVAAMIASLNG